MVEHRKLQIGDEDISVTQTQRSTEEGRRGRRACGGNVRQSVGGDDETVGGRETQWEVVRGAYGVWVDDRSTEGKGS